MQPKARHIMFGTNRMALSMAAAGAASALLATSAGAYTTATASFQRGVNGYTTQTDIQFTSNTGSGGTAGNNAGVLATTAASRQMLFVDGYDGAGSPDQQIFLKYDNLFGTGAGQIPVGAFILDATLAITTGTGSNAQSPGPWGVSAVLVPWTSSSTYNSLKPAGSPNEGLNYRTGALSRASGFYDDPRPYLGGNNTIDVGQRVTANVTQIVNGWSSGAVPNYGFSVNAGYPESTGDGWQLKLSTHDTIADRPALNVTYTTAPVSTARFQQGANGYNGTSMIWLRDDGTTEDGATLNNAFLDGWATGDIEDNVSADDHALVKFNNVFTSEGGLVPKTARVVKAYLKVTTSDVGNAQTGHPFEVRQMTTNWSTSTDYTDFDPFGPRPGVHESNEASVNWGMTPGSDAYFDVTKAVESWQNGAPNYGFDIRSHEDPNDIWNNTNGTSDGWSIYFTGASDISVRPELIVNYILRLPGDANENGVIDRDDFALIDRGRLMNKTGWENGDFNMDGTVDAADYLLIDTSFKNQTSAPLSASFLAAREAEFGAEYVAALVAAVPEPGTLSLVAVAVGAGLVRRRRA